MFWHVKCLTWSTTLKEPKDLWGGSGWIQRTVSPHICLSCYFLVIYACAYNVCKLWGLFGIDLLIVVCFCRNSYNLLENMSKKYSILCDELLTFSWESWTCSKVIKNAHFLNLHPSMWMCLQIVFGHKWCNFKWIYWICIHLNLIHLSQKWKVFFHFYLSIDTIPKRKLFGFWYQWLWCSGKLQVVSAMSGHSHIMCSGVILHGIRPCCQRPYLEHLHWCLVSDPAQ